MLPPSGQHPGFPRAWQTQRPSRGPAGTAGVAAILLNRGTLALRSRACQAPRACCPAGLGELLQELPEPGQRQPDDGVIVALDPAHELPGKPLDAIGPRLVERLAG